MLTLLDLPIEIRFQIYRELELGRREPISLGKQFAALAAYDYPPQLLQISHQVCQEARMAFSATSKRPWKINVIASIDAKLSLPDVLPDGLAQSAHIQFNFEFPHERGPVGLVYIGFGKFRPVQSQPRRETLFQAVHRVERGIDEICRRLAEVPVKRDMEICWSDAGDVAEWETKKTVLQPFSRLRKSCSFRLGKVLVWEGVSRQELASYLKSVTTRVPELTGSKEPVEPKIISKDL
ncbi:hypothetical protein HO173_002344 [Letharia columbiana]|uniref:Uncharacterized protein n=1 Tax=Letharia columbiana TaxID=112416 RepID=A0A8H6L8M9_9LECA|nr:uncharacterized protein HO173_002344 [Letharia columbiana]KAF6239798.1 hypothetical protein HO173_002344 [Letharia columbiana]